MKLSKTTWIFLAIGIFIIAFASLGMAYSQQNKEQSRLSHKLSLTQQLLTKQSDKFSSQQRELESRLVEAESQIGAAKTNLRQSIESIEVTDTLFEIAQTYYVEIIKISSPGVTSKELEEGLTCSILSLTVKVSGDVPDLINFTLDLSREFPTGVVETVKIEVPKVTEEEVEGETEEEPGKPLAEIVLRIYTYEGD